MDECATKLQSSSDASTATSAPLYVDGGGGGSKARVDVESLAPPQPPEDGEEAEAAASSMLTSKPEEVLLLCASMSAILTTMALLSIFPAAAPPLSPDDGLFLPPGLVLDDTTASAVLEATSAAPLPTFPLPRKLLTMLPQLFTNKDMDAAYLLTTAWRGCPGGVESRAGEKARKLSVSLSKLSRRLFRPSDPPPPRQSSTAIALMQALRQVK